jgi:SAM-dependent methyltransferase
VTGATLKWGREALAGWTKGRVVLEVGSQEVNGSFREFVEPEAAVYIGTDITPGRGVDLICPAERIVRTFGRGAFDLVICTELLEHVEDWRTVIRNLKIVTVIGGLIVVTTRMPGFPFHGYPDDFWRFTADDLRTMFADCDLLSVVEHPNDRGVYLLARRTFHLEEPPVMDLARAR